MCYCLKHNKVYQFFRHGIDVHPTYYKHYNFTPEKGDYIVSDGDAYWKESPEEFLKNNLVIHSITQQEVWESWIGKQVVKRSGKPFKSKEKVGIPLAITVSLKSGKESFEMNDGSVVDCYQIQLYEGDKDDK